MADIEKIAEDVGEAVEEKIEEKAEEISDAIEKAEERAERAEENAEAIAEAALENERGHRISRAEERIEECLRKMEMSETQMKSEMAAMESRILERISSQSLSIQPTSMNLPEAETIVEEIQTTPPESAEDQKEAEISEAVEKPAERKRRRRWI